MTVNAPLQSALSSFLSGYSIALNSTVTGSSVTLAALNYKTGLDNNITLNSGASITASGIVRLAAGDAAKYAIANPPNLQTGPSTIALNGATVTSTGGNVFLLAGTGGSLDIAGPGGVQAPSGAVSIVANSLNVTGSPTIMGTSLTIAPATQGATVSLGGGEAGLVIGQSALAALGGVGTLSVGVAATPSATSEAFTTAITAGSIDVAGAVNVGANTLALSSTGDITGAGQITAGLLTATSTNPTGQVSLTNPANAVAALGAVSADALTFIDGVPLTLDGNITATDIQIGAAQLLTVANGITITTGFDPLAQVPASQAPPDSNGSTGLNLAILNGAGTIVLGPNVTMQPTSGTGETVRLALTGGGLVQFNAFNAPNADVLLHVGSGSASGSLNVASLSAFYQTGFLGPINLIGSVGGQGGSAAASAGRIGQEPTAPPAFSASTNVTPLPGPTFQLNNCTITAPNCTFSAPAALSTQLLVLSVSPLALISDSSTLRLPPLRLALAVADSELDDPDLLLPYISDRDN